MSAQVYSAPGQTEGRTKIFLDWKSIGLSSKLPFTCVGNIKYYKSVHHSIPTRGIGNILAIFKKKSVSSHFSWVSRYIIFLTKLKRKGRPSLELWRVQEWGGILWDYPRRAFRCHKRWKSLSFCELWNNLTPFY